ncbi:MAG: ACP S-malonyltransferase, partial [Planctomycetota bacterium]|jgi:[acyl-carrier-protein] S-malonyltransferase
MNSAAEALGEALANCRISEPGDIQIISNINADYYEGSETITEGLVKQLTSPLLWQKCMEKLLADGVEKFYEIGPGRVLTGLMRRINRKTKVVNVSSLESIKGLSRP